MSRARFLRLADTAMRAEDLEREIAARRDDVVRAAKLIAEDRAKDQRIARLTVVVRALEAAEMAREDRA